MIIKLYDNEGDYDFPLIEIEDNFAPDFHHMLNSYRDNNNSYNIDDFMEALEDKHWFIRGIYSDEEVYF